MCSIFGFVARDKNSRPDLNTIARIVHANINRGPHAFGFAWIDANGRLRSFKQAGKLTRFAGLITMLRGARMLIGHLRFSTHGDPSANINNHPHPSDGGWIVHNGVVRNYEDLIEERNMLPNSDCDSEAIAIMMEEGSRSILNRAADAINATTGSCAVIGLWSRPNTMIVAKRGNPLHTFDTIDGQYFATLADGLPGDVRPIADNSVRLITVGEDGKRVDSVKRLEADQWVRPVSTKAGAYRGG